MFSMNSLTPKNLYMDSLLVTADILVYLATDKSSGDAKHSDAALSKTLTIIHECFSFFGKLIVSFGRSGQN